MPGDRLVAPSLPALREPGRSPPPPPPLDRDNLLLLHPHPRAHSLLLEQLDPRLPKRLLDLPQGVIGLGWFAAAISLEDRAC